MSNQHLLPHLNLFIVQRRWLLLSLLVITALGFTSKFYRGPAAWWFNNYVGGLLYEVFWCLLGILLFSKAKPLWIALCVLAITCFLEVLQLWHPPVLKLVRSTFIGRTLIGTTFSSWDFFCYVIGCFIGWLWMRRFSES